jgi:hypothetical protein
MNNDHICQHCGKNFPSSKTLYKHRWGSCFWLNHTKRKTTSNYNYEKPLNENEKEILLRELLVQVTTLSTNVKDLRKEVSMLKQKQKISIIKHLNSSNPPNITIKKWIQNISISQQHLENVFKTSITNGILNILQDTIETSTILNHKIPIISFTQKPKTIYIYNYNDDKKWTICTPTLFNTLCLKISARIFETFLQWQKLNKDYLLSGDDSQEQFSLFTQKVMDTSYKNNISNIMDSLYNSLQTTFQQNDYIDEDTN